MPNSEWRKQRGGQPMTWQRSMKEITKRLSALGATRLSGWGPLPNIFRTEFCQALMVTQASSRHLHELFVSYLDQTGLHGN
ncbi:hypothetical protein T265_07705 [Opisthorchis viverrini]|uniref:Uncharacterized protein n=1 Tax=Opisthorchis viverrini TaxID=6198 RepID=A0A074ZC44_OPIVI|nr:hypothetical protein T265_07705 [Opisthorchis viverrini]KER24708.1 hypothetical protein T265_07705 [Opisthorchis viverrini]